MTDAVDPPVAPAEPDPAAFAVAAAEGPFGFKPDRNRPIEPHFDGFGRLTPEQAREVLDVRDGRRPRCVLHLPGESVLVEHAGQGYCDPATGVAWGYRVRRVGHDGPAAPPPPPTAEPPADVVPEPSPPPLPTPPAVVVAVAPRPAPVAEPPRPASADPPPLPPPEWDDQWTAPARSPRAAALADPAERAALVRVLILWFVVALLLAESAAVLAGGR